MLGGIMWKIFASRLINNISGRVGRRVGPKLYVRMERVHWLMPANQRTHGLGENFTDVDQCPPWHCQYAEKGQTGISKYFLYIQQIFNIGRFLEATTVP